MGVKIREVLPTKDFSLYLYGIIFFRSEDLFCWRAKLVFNSIRINFLWNRKNFYYQRVKTWHFNFWNASFIRLTTKGKNSTIKKQKVDRNFCFKCASNHAAVTGRESVSFFFISSLLSLQWLVLSLKCLIVPFFLFPKPTNFPTFTFFFQNVIGSLFMPFNFVSRPLRLYFYLFPLFIEMRMVLRDGFHLVGVFLLSLASSCRVNNTNGKSIDWSSAKQRSERMSESSLRLNFTPIVSDSWLERAIISFHDRLVSEFARGLTFSVKSIRWKFLSKWIFPYFSSSIFFHSHGDVSTQQTVRSIVELSLRKETVYRK